MWTCAPSTAPKHCGNCQWLKKFFVFSCTSALVIGRRISCGPICSHIALQTLLTMTGQKSETVQMHLLSSSCVPHQQDTCSRVSKLPVSQLLQNLSFRLRDVQHATSAFHTKKSGPWHSKIFLPLFQRYHIVAKAVPPRLSSPWLDPESPC